MIFFVTSVVVFAGMGLFIIYNTLEGDNVKSFSFHLLLLAAFFFITVAWFFCLAYINHLT